MTISFTCQCCGREIEGLPDLAFDAPLHYHEVPEAERDRRAELDTDLCVIDGEMRFIRAVCPVPIQDTVAFFGLGIWVSLSEESFGRYRESFGDAQQSRIGNMFGWFANRIGWYPDTLNLQTTVEPRDDNSRPFVWINAAHADHPLYREQRDGIARERLGEIYAAEMCDGGH